MAKTTVAAHRDYPDAEPSDDKDLEPSYDGPDQGYDAIDADPDGGDQVDAETGFPALDVSPVLSADAFPILSADAFPETLFDDQPRKARAAGPGHGDS